MVDKEHIDYAGLKRSLGDKLSRLGIDSETIDLVHQSLDEIAHEDVPELQALEAVRELRFLFRETIRHLPTNYVRSKPRYSLVKSGESPIDFLFHHYGKEIREGTIGPGQISKHDSNLYSMLRNHLKKMPEWQDKTLADFFRDCGPHPERQSNESNIVLRARACAQILETDEAAAATFLASLRQDALRRHDLSEGKGRG